MSIGQPTLPKSKNKKGFLLKRLTAIFLFIKHRFWLWPINFLLTPHYELLSLWTLCAQFFPSFSFQKSNEFPFLHTKQCSNSAYKRKNIVYNSTRCHRKMAEGTLNHSYRDRGAEGPKCPNKLCHTAPWFLLVSHYGDIMNLLLLAIVCFFTLIYITVSKDMSSSVDLYGLTIRKKHVLKMKVNLIHFVKFLFNLNTGNFCT